MFEAKLTKVLFHALHMHISCRLYRMRTSVHSFRLLKLTPIAVCWLPVYIALPCLSPCPEFLTYNYGGTVCIRASLVQFTVAK